jgi:ATP-dependent Clp protease ATP-binding subunit ClpA
MSTRVNDVRSILVRDARQVAQADGSATIEAEHVLLALAALEHTEITSLLAEAGLTPLLIQRALDQEWEQGLAVAGVRIDVATLPRPTPDPDRRPRIGESTVQVLKRATACSSALGGGRIGVGHILIGLLDADRSRVARALDAAGVDRVALRTKAFDLLAQGNR